MKKDTSKRHKRQGSKDIRKSVKRPTTKPRETHRSIIPPAIRHVKGEHMAYETIVAVYDTAAHAKAAVKALKAGGGACRRSQFSSTYVDASGDCQSWHCFCYSSPAHSPVPLRSRRSDTSCACRRLKRHARATVDSSEARSGS
jgi:hypothetical protein